jgi:hypothetical protein
MDLIASDYALVSGNLQDFEKTVMPRLLELGLETRYFQFMSLNISFLNAVKPPDALSL